MLACRRLCRGVDAEVYAGVDADGCLCAGRGACATLFQGYFLINYLEQSWIVVHR